ncbi:MAG: hypothetical protein PHP92_04170 [Candidatus Nanoarchaeia archaeon]|nr:hypothetical protein [Candidatus Nanoarchaeia archaeon]
MNKIVKEHQIIFSTEMIKQILSGNKTQTRRIIKHHHPSYDYPENIAKYEFINFDGERVFFRDTLGPIASIKCPYGRVGYTLWVKEIYCNYIPLKRSLNINANGSQEDVIYKASHRLQDMEGFEDIILSQDIRWKTPMFMPKRYSRIKLEIINIEVERVQDINFTDVIAEGLDEKIDGHSLSVTQLRSKFWRLWDSINKKKGFGWDMNPWVWKIEFKKI